MHGICIPTFGWLSCVGKYTIHGCYGAVRGTKTSSLNKLLFKTKGLAFTSSSISIDETSNHPMMHWWSKYASCSMYKTLVPRWEMIHLIGGCFQDFSSFFHLSSIYDFVIGFIGRWLSGVVLPRISTTFNFPTKRIGIFYRWKLWPGIFRRLIYSSF